MEIGVEISLYPLKTHFRPDIHEFIRRLAADGRLKVVSNSMSTQVFGRYEHVLEALGEHLHACFEQLESASAQAVCVMKMIGPLPDAGATGASTI